MNPFRSSRVNRPAHGSDRSGDRRTLATSHKHPKRPVRTGIIDVTKPNEGQRERILTDTEIQCGERERIFNEGDNQ